jgi:site-specific DNA-methyltransferase (adenine-specific)/modification methylase
MKDNSVNVVITSPPYNMNLRIMNGKYCSRQIVKEFSTKYNGFSDNLPIEEFYDLHSTILRELIRVSDIVFYNIQIVTGSKRAFFKIIGEFSDNLKDIIVWDKT